VAPLVRMLATGSPFGKAAAASALCSMAEDKEVAAFVTKAGALPQLVLLLTCGDPSGKLQVLSLPQAKPQPDPRLPSVHSHQSIGGSGPTATLFQIGF